MKLENFLKEIENNCSKITYFCATHMINKKFNDKSENFQKELIKEFFINYENYELFLSDYASVIYNKFNSSKEEVYKELCKFLDENPDNKYLFLFRLKKVSNQNPLNYLNIEDKQTRDNIILKLENKVNTIENSFYYKENYELVGKEVLQLKKSLEIVKTVARER